MEINLDIKELAKSIVNESLGFWKKNKIWIIIIFCLTIITIVSTGFAIYYGKTGTSDYANQMKNTLSELRNENAELKGNLDKITIHLFNAENYAAQLEENKNSALEIIAESDKAINEMKLEQLIQANTITALRESITALANFTRNQIKINTRTKQTLGE